jgi:nucleoid-associated protein YgaU
MYGDPTRWRAIAEANGIDDPLALRRGRTLSIPRPQV